MHVPCDGVRYRPLIARWPYLAATFCFLTAIAAHETAAQPIANLSWFSVKWNFVFGELAS